MFGKSGKIVLGKMLNKANGDKAEIQINFEKFRRATLVVTMEIQLSELQWQESVLCKTPLDLHGEPTPHGYYSQ